ncbi:MAG: acyltransferase [Bacteriovoracia bacterium]
MTLAGRIVSLFPAFYLFCLMGWIGKMFYSFNWYDLLILPALVYLMPLLFHRVHFLFFPFSDGFWPLSEKKYNPWWASHMFQFPFIACPWIESLLHFVPGLYSAWLRAWGSKIGKGIYWTPRVEIVDRGLIEVGDGTVFGHISALCSHMVADIEGKPSLVVKKIIIGERVFIGADSQLGPGVVIPERTKLKPKSRLYWRGEWLP